MAKLKGKMLGNWGQASIYSYQTTKPLPSIEGGMGMYKERELYDVGPEGLFGRGWARTIDGETSMTLTDPVPVAVPRMKAGKMWDARSTDDNREFRFRVIERAPVTVPAGTFDTYVIVCKRYSTSSNSWRATRKYYYAPELGHYVIRDDTFRSRSDRTRRLVAYGFNSTFLPEQEQINLNRRLQDALSRNPDGIASTWKSKPGDITAMLVPVNSYTASNGEECRDYYSIYSVKGRIRKNARSVCKQPEGSWQRVD